MTRNGLRAFLCVILSGLGLYAVAAGFLTINSAMMGAGAICAVIGAALLFGGPTDQPGDDR